MNMGRVDYEGGPPLGYRCSTCGARNCKLWREYQTFADRTQLLCCDCAGKSQRRDVSGIRYDGKTRGPFGWSDQIGWLVPAVPHEEGDTFWGYTSVPDAGVRWWKALPSRGQP